MALRDEFISALVAAKIPSPRLETDIILKYATPAYPDFSSAEEAAARVMLARRLRHEPLDKVIGSREFYKYRFKVNADVLSPRPDTEILLESALAHMPQDKPVRILDLGTGSGCILLSLLKECPQASGIGVDVSAPALAVAKENAAALGVEGQAEFVNKSWNEIDFSGQNFDIIVSNPPYIPTAEIAGLAPEVREYDPACALDGGMDGFCCYREIAALAPLILKSGGYILLEAGAGQAAEIAALFAQKGLEYEQSVSDLAGINRCVILKK